MSLSRLKSKLVSEVTKTSIQKAPNSFATPDWTPGSWDAVNRKFSIEFQLEIPGLKRWLSRQNFSGCYSPTVFSDPVGQIAAGKHVITYLSQILELFELFETRKGSLKCLRTPSYLFQSTDDLLQIGSALVSRW